MTKKLKILLLIPAGRVGSTFFLSLTDRHEQIMQFPGEFSQYLPHRRHPSRGPSSHA